MTREEFSTLSKDHILYLDGATGSNLVKAGMPSGVCPEQWILEHRDVMLKLQKDYVQAGTNILYAPTFTANRVKLAEYHLEKNMSAMIHELVAISREAAASSPGHTVLVAGDLTMTGEQLKPMGQMELEDLIDIYKEQILSMVDAGVDLLVVETMMSLAETRAALIAAKEVCDLPVIATLTFEADGRTLFGTDAKTAAIVLESLGASAIGANCSTGPAQMESIISDMVTHTRIPVIAKPNAGLPFLDENGNTCYNMEAEEFTEEMEILVNAGATILGGCCGTTPEFIRQIHDRFGTEAKATAARRPEGIRYLTSERITHSFGLEDGFFVVGERINPTGKKALQAQLKEGSFEKVIQFAEEQEACGAKVLDINMGMSGIDEKASMLRALEEVSGVTNLPLSLDSSYVEVLEAALRHYPGRALVNSVSLETEKFEKLLPIVAKYGAMFILLPLSDAGLPKDIDEKKEIIHKIYDRATSLGMHKEDIVVDGLVATVGANPKAALETLETIRYCKANGFATICGLSNISFAMPERSFVNTAFLTLAIQAGLTMAIANPSQELLVSCSSVSETKKIVRFFSPCILFLDIIRRQIYLESTGMFHPDICVRYYRPVFPYGAILRIYGDPAFHQNVPLCYFTAGGYFGHTASNDHLRDHTVVLCHQIPACLRICSSFFRNRHIIFLQFNKKTYSVQSSGGPGDLWKIAADLFFQFSDVQIAFPHSGMYAFLLQKF